MLFADVLLLAFCIGLPRLLAWYLRRIAKSLIPPSRLVIRRETVYGPLRTLVKAALSLLVLAHCLLLMLLKNATTLMFACTGMAAVCMLVGMALVFYDGGDLLARRLGVGFVTMGTAAAAAAEK